MVIKAGVNDWDKIIIEQENGDELAQNGGVSIDQVDSELAQFEEQIQQMGETSIEDQMGGQEQMGQPTGQSMGQPQGGMYAR